MFVCRFPTRQKVPSLKALFFVSLRCLSCKQNYIPYNSWQTYFPSSLKFLIQQSLPTREYQYIVSLSLPPSSYNLPDYTSSRNHQESRNFRQYCNSLHGSQMSEEYLSLFWTSLHTEAYSLKKWQHCYTSQDRVPY